MNIQTDSKFFDSRTGDLIVSYIIEDKGKTSYWIYNYTKKEVRGMENEDYIIPLHKFFDKQNITIHWKKHLYNN